MLVSNAIFDKPYKIAVGQFQRDLRDILAIFLSSWANNSANKSLNDMHLLPIYKKNDYVGWCQTKFL